MFERFMTGWLTFYADVLMTIGLIGLLACITRGIIAFGEMVERRMRG